MSGQNQEVNETLEVIEYFDALIRAGVGLDALLSGAAAISGVAAGAEHREHITRRSPDGRSAPPREEIRRSSQLACSIGTIWLEREGDATPTDVLILQRLSLAVDLIEARRGPVGDLELVLDARHSIGERTKALGRLRIAPSSRIRVIATRPTTGQALTPLSRIIPTQHGILLATVCRADAVDAEPPSLPAGIGEWVTADHAPQSWEGAMISLQMTMPNQLVVEARQMGALLRTCRDYDPELPDPDVHAIARLDPRSAYMLQVLVEADSLRAAATILGVHHSTLQAKHEALTKELGYDPRAISGRVRYGVAEMYRRLTDPRILADPNSWPPSSGSEAAPT